nr:S-layer homology domain-containing protein [uncultured Oscillibacter sp.]
MKKTLAAFLLALLLLTGGASAFSDVDEGLYYAAPIAWAVERGITTGTSEDTFSPDALCTQGQILTFLWRAAGSPQADAEILPPGLPADSVSPSFREAVAWAYQSGVLGGAAGLLNPAAPCGRGMAMGFLWRYAGSPAASAPNAFTDVDSGTDHAQAVAWAVETGITSGTSETTFSPDEPCTRGQIATFLYRCLNGTGEKVQLPEEPVPQSPAPEPEEEARPLRTYAGTGEARSLGLDGSEFTSEGLYEAEVTVDVYSPYEAVFTIQIPFPLFQACNYLVRFDNPEKPEASYIFIFLRWDEAFADMIPWEGDHDSFRFVDTSDQDGFLSVHQDADGDDRIGGTLVRRVTFSRGSYFTFDMLDGYAPSCFVSTNP